MGDGWPARSWGDKGGGSNKQLIHLIIITMKFPNGSFLI